MIYNQLFAQVDRDVRVGVIGTGQYATALITQSQVVERLDVPVVCDTNPDAAQNAYDQAGLDSDKTIICETSASGPKGNGRRPARYSHRRNANDVLAP